MAWPFVKLSIKQHTIELYQENTQNKTNNRFALHLFIYNIATFACMQVEMVLA